MNPLDEPALFSVPKEYGNVTFILDFKGEQIFSEKISVDKTIPFITGISPTITAAAFPTKFKVGVNSTSNISKYIWEWADETQTTFNDEATITFDSIVFTNLPETVNIRIKTSISVPAWLCSK